LHSVSVVGSRAATAYGSHVATELSAELSGLGWTVISGGAKVLYPETVVAPRRMLDGLMPSSCMTGDAYYGKGAPDAG
jgi:DNA processing protein